MGKQVNLTSMDFNDLKTSLKEYMKGQTELKDYNFEGSVINTLLDIFAYNTYHQAFYLNMIGNEMFLDSATLRENVISNAKKLDYLPKSKKASRAKLQLTIYPDDNPNQIIIPKHSEFVTTYNNENYSFITLEDYLVQPDNSGMFIKEIDVYEGIPLTYTFTVGSSSKFFEIKDPNIDTSIMTVYVKENSLSTERTLYKQVSDITDVKGTSEVYFLQMNYNNNYELYFGDDVIGKKLSIDNVVEVETLICRGADANEISTLSQKSYVAFQKDDPSKFYSNVLIKVLTSSTDGQDEETIDSIKFSAPKKYALQKRIVTSQDWKNWLLSEYTDIESISVWGGETHNPPLFGKVVLSIKPFGSYSLSTTRKAEMVLKLGERSMLSIDPVIIDPDITFINLTTTIVYNSRKTTLNPDTIASTAANIFKDYENNILGRFEGIFYLSNLTSSIQNVDASIADNSTEVLIEKRLSPVLNSTMTYNIDLNCSLKHPYDGYLGCLSSGGFKLSQYGSAVVYLDDDGNGNVRIYKWKNSSKSYLNEKAGSIDYESGSLKLDAFEFTDIYGNYEFLKILFQPLVDYYVPQKNEILLMASPQIKMYDINTNSFIKTVTVTTIGSDNILYNNYVKVALPQ